MRSATTSGAYRNSDGLVFKTTNSRFSNLHGQGHSNACLFLKGDSYAPFYNSTFTNVTCSTETNGDTSQALEITPGTGPLEGAVVTNFSASGTVGGVSSGGGSDAAHYMRSIALSNLNMVIMNGGGGHIVLAVGGNTNGVTSQQTST